jgi:DNA-binding SARP family transcriptional activator
MIYIKLFGSMSAEVDGRTITASELGGRPRQVLELLALEAGSPVAKERIADLLWEGAPPASYVGTLESYISVLRRNMGLGRGRSCVLATLPNAYRLEADAVTVDLLEFRRLVASMADARASVAIPAMRQALELANGPLLANEPYAAWACRSRELFQRELVTACIHAAQLSNGIGDFRAAEHFASLATEHDPLSEVAWQHLMRSFWFSGLRAEALRAYMTLRERMLDELGDEPGSESQELYFAILRDTPSVRRDSTGGGGMEVRTLLLLLRQALDVLPGIQAPARDSALAQVAVSALERTP